MTRIHLSSFCSWRFNPWCIGKILLAGTLLPFLVISCFINSRSPSCPPPPSTLSVAFWLVARNRLHVKATIQYCYRGYKHFEDLSLCFFGSNFSHSDNVWKWWRAYSNNYSRWIYIHMLLDAWDNSSNHCECLSGCATCKDHLGGTMRRPLLANLISSKWKALPKKWLGCFHSWLGLERPFHCFQTWSTSPSSIWWSCKITTKTTTSIWLLSL